MIKKREKEREYPPLEATGREFCYEVILYEIIKGKKVVIERQQGSIDQDKFKLYGEYDVDGKNKYVSS
jgi:hypothetical protein